MKDIKRIKLQLIWDTFGKEEFGRKDVYKQIKKYINENYTVDYEIVRKIIQGFEYYYAIGCLKRVAPCRYVLDEEFFDTYVFAQVD